MKNTITNILNKVKEFINKHKKVIIPVCGAILVLAVIAIVLFAIPKNSSSTVKAEKETTSVSAAKKSASGEKATTKKTADKEKATTKAKETKKPAETTKDTDTNNGSANNANDNTQAAENNYSQNNANNNSWDADQSYYDGGNNYYDQGNSGGNNYYDPGNNGGGNNYYDPGNGSGGGGYVAPTQPHSQSYQEPQTQAPTQPATTQPAHQHSWAQHYSTIQKSYEEPVYELHMVCGKCGAFVENLTYDERDAHSYSCGVGWATRNVQVGTDTVYYNEDVPDYIYCTDCGAKK